MSRVSYRGAVIDTPFESDEVYLPAEDSYLMADCACSALFEKGGLLDTKETVDVLEVGCGSGFVSAVLAAQGERVRVFACDINPAAVALSTKNGIQARLSDMFEIFGHGDVFDMILFNPPYLPTSDDEKVPGWLNYAFDGGPTGRETIVRFLDNVGSHLKPDGFFLLLISSITGRDAVEAEMEKRGFSSCAVGSVKCSFEELIVLRGDRRETETVL